MAVYFAQAGAGGPVKIGTTDDVQGRLRELQCGCPQELILLREINGSRATEAWLHRRFSALRLRAEWFHFHDEMLDIEPPEVAEVTGPHNPFIDALGGIAEIAGLLNLSPSRVGNWRARGVPWRFRYRIAELAAERGINLPDKFLEAA